METAKENTTHPSAHESQHANRYIDMCNNIMAGASLNNLKTKMEWTRLERHVIPIAMRQYQTIVAVDDCVFCCCLIRCNTALYNINTTAELIT
mmetsp:Transcript_32819/g.55573  ORF Transcript_32819/g.55573 Transcript_32819/m.55573 type:complete len:93 (-) Transcript_32819:538-816(-)